MEFQNHIFIKQHQQGFIWESAWDSFRPIKSFAWNGTRYEIDDQSYCQNPLDPNYGYGSPDMKAYCKKLGLPTQLVQGIPSIGQTEWWFDRDIVLTPCCPRDKSSWRRMHGGQYRTLRHLTRNKFTRRNRKHV